MKYYSAACWLIATLLGGCAGTTARLAPAPVPSPSMAGLQSEDYPAQRLYRVRYQGEGGQAAFRVVLRLSDPETFQVTAVDTLGRTLWGIEYSEPEVHFINYRELLECRASRPLVISEIALELVPVGDLPALLLGRLPTSLAGARQNPDLSLTDSLGRRWSLATDGGGLQRWTLWGQSGPLLWFQRLERGGILSHRGGSQFRWRETLSEELTEKPSPLELPTGVTSVPCEKMAATG